MSQSRQHPQDKAAHQHNDVGSLSDYIAKHLQKRGETPAAENTPNNKPTFIPQAYSQQNKPTTEKGLVLNQLDTQLANQRIERYVPAATTRLNLSKERLSRELKEIYDQLTHYRQFHGEEYAHKIEALEERAQLLQRKIFDLDMKLSRLNPFHNMMSQFQQWTGQNANPDRWTLIPNPKHHNDAKSQMQQVNQELQSIHAMLSQQLHDPALSPEQLGRLINEYDAHLYKAEQLKNKLKSKPDFGQQLSQTLNYLMKGQQPT